MQATHVLTEVMFDDAPLFVRQLKAWERTPSLDLSNKKLGFLSATAIAGLLPTNSAPTDLNLLGNDMARAGCRAVARAARHSALRGLNLASNALGHDGTDSAGWCRDTRRSRRCLPLAPPRRRSWRCGGQRSAVR